MIYKKVKHEAFYQSIQLMAIFQVLTLNKDFSIQICSLNGLLTIFYHILHFFWGFKILSYLIIWIYILIHELKKLLKCMNVLLNFYLFIHLIIIQLNCHSVLWNHNFNSTWKYCSNSMKETSEDYCDLWLIKIIVINLWLNILNIMLMNIYLKEIMKPFNKNLYKQKQINKQMKNVNIKK